MGTLGNYANRYLLHLHGRGGREGVSQSDCCAVVPGTTILKIVVLRIAIGTPPITTTTTTVFRWCALRRALFCTRAGGWEFVGSVEEESMLVPVMSVTISKNKTGLGSLVGENRTVAQLYKLIACNLAESP